MNIAQRSVCAVGAWAAIVFAVNALAQAPSLGRIDFPTSAAPAPQEKFVRGVLLLHSFEYEDAREAFREAESLDPNFALAYWGEAMTSNHTLWQEQDRDAARAALNRLASTPDARQAKAPTEREKGFLRAVEALYGEGDKPGRDRAYAAAMRELHERFPKDVEITSFYALAILGTAEGQRDFRTYMQAAALLEEIFPGHPDHPGIAHYLIHSYDDPIHAPLGLRAARLYSGIAPDAAHAQHMTSHIFLALGMWDDEVRANEIAVGVTNRARARRGALPVACGHYNFWLEYGYLQQGRPVEAKRVLAGCREEALRRNASAHEHAAADPDRSAIGSYLQMWTRYVLDAQGWNDEVLGWPMDRGDRATLQFRDHFTRGFAAAQRGDWKVARAALAALEDVERRLASFYTQQAIPAGDALRRVPTIQIQQLRALLLAGEGHGDEAVALLHQAASTEESMPFEFGPPVVDKPSHELLGEVLLKLGKPAEAQKAFQAALERAPRRALALQGLARASERAGHADAAKSVSADRVHN